MKTRQLPAIVFILLSVLLFPLYPENQAAADTVIKCGENALPGGIIQVTAVSLSGIENLYAELMTESGIKIAGFRGFSYLPELTGADGRMPDPGKASQLKCMIAIMGIDPALKSGRYRILVTAGSENREFAVNIGNRDFRRDEIKLNESLTDLRTDESIQRQKETEELVRLFTLFENRSIYSSGTIINPLKNTAVSTSHYGDRRKFLYIDGGSSSSVHNGIDYAVETGTVVYSCAPGRVVFAGQRLITGGSVIIEHLPGLYSVYYHLDKIQVAENTVMESGAVIGLSGNTGLSTGPHLHWEVRNQMTPLDPEIFIISPLIDKDRIISIINSDFSDYARGR